MFEAEARWLRRALDAFPPERLSPLLNLGSSSAVVRKAVQPWIDARVFCPLNNRGIQIFHVDMRELPGVDIRADLTDAADVGRLGALAPKALLCCNLLDARRPGGANRSNHLVAHLDGDASAEQQQMRQFE
jgi:hypothetical protein